VVEAADLAEAWTAFRAARRDYLVVCTAIVTQRKRARAQRSALPPDSFDFDAELQTAACELAEDEVVVLTRDKHATEDALWAAVAALELVWVKYGLRGQSLSATSKG
jgi:hypothetical protein